MARRNLFFSFVAIAQEVTVTPGNHSVVLSIPARKSYQILTTEAKEPTLSIECTAKGKKSVHVLMFAPGGAVAEDNPETVPRSKEFELKLTMGGTKQEVAWIPYGDVGSFAYYGKLEPERVKFIQSLLTNPTVSIEFKPFLTGVPVVTTFDLSTLRDEVAKHPECSFQSPETAK